MRLILFLLLMLTACNYETEKMHSADLHASNLNPLDTILGDKLISTEDNIIRNNNFKSLLNLPGLNLQMESKIYFIDPVADGLFLIRQKKSYTNARLFSLIVKVENEKISSYYILNDFNVIDFQETNDALILLCSNFNNTCKYWSFENEIKVLKLSSSLKEIWQYTAKSHKYSLDGNKLDLKQGKCNALINIITGCHICFNTIELEIDEVGNCTNVTSKSKTNSTVNIDQFELNEIFKNGHKTKSQS